MPQPHSHRGGPPRPSQLPSGISWRSSHRAHAGFWQSVGTHSLLILYALKENVVDKIRGVVGLCLFVLGWKWDGRQMSRGPGTAARCCVMDTALMWVVSFSEGPAQRGTVAGGAQRSGLGEARPCSAGHRAVWYKLCNSRSQWVRGFSSILKTQTHSPPHLSLNLLERAAHHVVLVGFRKG